MNALILVDIQNDFMPGGSLAVPEGDEIVALVNQLQSAFEIVIATKDWHPAEHGSFAANHPGRQPGDMVDLNGLDQILWPVHCVQDSAGAAFHPKLSTDGIQRVFYKGTRPEVDSYSTFYDNAHRNTTGLAEYLHSLGVSRVYLVGLATDYCVKFSALDALGEGFETYVVMDACRGVELQTGDTQAALGEMENAGAHLIDSTELLKN